MAGKEDKRIVQRGRSIFFFFFFFKRTIVDRTFKGPTCSRIVIWKVTAAAQHWAGAQIFHHLQADAMSNFIARKWALPVRESKGRQFLNFKDWLIGVLGASSHAPGLAEHVQTLLKAVGFFRGMKESCGRQVKVVDYFRFKGDRFRVFRGQPKKG